jgi:hypothetical protein
MPKEYLFKGIYIYPHAIAALGKKNWRRTLNDFGKVWEFFLFN